MITHALETRSEMLYNLERYGKPALQRLADIGVLTQETVLEHFVWVTDDELRIFADSGAVASNDAGSNLRLSSGICRVRDIMDTGGRIAFGTDGISFSDREDFFQELRLACYLQRMPHTFERQRLDSEAVLRAAATNGARALGMAGSARIARSREVRRPVGRRQGADPVPARAVRPRALPRRGARPGRGLRHRRGDGARTGPDGGRSGHGRRRGSREGAIRGRRCATASTGSPITCSGGRSSGRLVEPYVIDFYQRWYETPVEPAYVYNAQTGRGGTTVIIDAHSHILSLAGDPEFTIEYGREGSLCIYRSMGLLPSHRMPTEEEWEASGFTRKGWPVIGPQESLRDHPGFDKVVVLGISPQLLDGRLIGTVDTTGAPRRRRPDASRPVQRLHRRGRAGRTGSVHRVRVGEPPLPGPRRRRSRSSSERSSGWDSRA